MLKTGSRSFTLVEVMVTTAILSLGIVMVYKAYFSLLDAVSQCCDYLAIQPLIGQNLWQAEDDLERYGKLVNIDTFGSFRSKSKDFDWNLAADLIDGAKDFNLYRISMSISWKIAARNMNLSRQTYALCTKR